VAAHHMVHRDLLEVEVVLLASHVYQRGVLLVSLLLRTDLFGQGALLMLLLTHLLQVNVVLDIAVSHDHPLESRHLLS
jgi:hypothetical protein